MAREGHTGCEATEWESDTSVRCHVGQGARGTRRVVMTAGRISGTSSSSLSYDFVLASSSSRQNLASTGSFALTIIGAMASSASSQRARISSSSTERTFWMSGTSVRCRAAAGASHTRRLMLTSGSRLGSLSMILSFDIPAVSVVLSSSNGPATGSVYLTLTGMSLAQHGGSPLSRIGRTCCESSMWVSDTAVACRHTRGVAGTRQVSITMKEVTGSMSQASSYDRPSVSSMGLKNCPAAGSCVLEVFGSGFGSVDFTPIIRIGRTSCASTPWKSESSVKCRVPMGTGRNAGISTTVSGLVGSLTWVFSYDAPVIFANSLHVWPLSTGGGQSTALTLNSTVGNVSVAFYGKNFGVFPYDWVLTFGHPPDFDSYICNVNKQYSNDSFVLCQVPDGIGIRHRFRIVVDTQIASGTDVLNYPAPVLHARALRFAGSGRPFTESLIGNTTEGGFNSIEISGRNFGPYATDVYVTYGPLPSASRYTCTVNAATHTSIICSVDAGIGRNLVFNVTIGRQTVLSASVFHYPPPVLDLGSLSLVGKTLPSAMVVGSTTMGGIDIIQMTGSNFGPVAKDVIVKYGKYLSFNHTCATVEGFHQSLVRCVTASGTGKVHAFTVDVSGQVAGGSDRFDYPAPIFTSGSLRILGQKCAGPTKCYNVQKDGQGRVRAIARSTIEGTVVEIDGANFGPLADAVKMTLGSCRDPCPPDTYVPRYNCTVVVGPAVANNHTRVQCVLSSGMGVGHAFELTVDGQRAISGDRITFPDPLIYSGTVKMVNNLTSTLPEYIVKATRPVSVHGRSTVGKDLIQLRGRNFGPLAHDVSIFYGPPENRFKYQCAVSYVPGQWNHTTSHCAVEAGVGADHVFIVKSGPTLSVVSEDTFSYPKPELRSKTLRFAGSAPKVPNATGIESQATFSIANATSSTGNDVLQMEGKNFGPNPFDVAVTYSRLFSPYTFSAYVAVNQTNHTTIQLQTEEGIGQSLFMKVSVGGQHATGIDMFSYPRPEMASLTTGSRGANSTCASQSLIFSSSISLASAGVAQHFVVRARDWARRDTRIGGDLLEVRAIDAFTRLPNTTVVDNFDGTYSCYVHATITGVYTVSIRLQPLLKDLHKSPFAMRVLPSNIVEPSECTTLGIGGNVETAGLTASFQLDARDRFGNEIVEGDDLFFADAISDTGQNVTSFIQVPSFIGGQRQQSGFVLITRSAVYRLRLFYNGVGSKENPYVFTVIPNDAIASSSLLLGASRTITTSTDYFVSYLLQMRDAYANWRTLGGDNIVAAISSGPISDVTALKVTDNSNGSFTVENRLTRSGEYTISLGLGSFENALPFSPITITVLAGLPTASVSRASGSSLQQGAAGTLETFSILMLDKYANPCRVAGLNLEVTLYNVQDSSYVPVQHAAILFSDGLYSGEYQNTRSGQYLMTLLVVDEPIYGSPYSIFIDAAEVLPGSSTAFQTRSEYFDSSLAMPGAGSAREHVLKWVEDTVGMVGGVISQPFDIMIRARDRYGNAANRAGMIFDVSTDPSYDVDWPLNKGQGNLLTSFTPTNAHDSLKLNIKYQDEHIAASPFTVKIRNGLGATSGAHCFALGDGTCVGTAGVVGVFLLQAADQYGRYKTSGGDMFQVTMSMDSTASAAAVLDRKSGSYAVNTTTTKSGVYALRITFGGSHIQGSPYSVHIMPGKISAKHCTVHRLAVATAGLPATFEIRARDKFHNILVYNRVDGRDLFNVKMTGPVVYVPTVRDLSNSSYVVSYKLTVSGKYSATISTRVSTELVGGKLFRFDLVSSRVDPRSSTVYGAGLQSASAGSQSEIFARLRDVYGNVANGAMSSMRAFANATSLALIGDTVSDGTLSIKYSMTKSGVYIVSLKAFVGTTNSSLLDLGGSPFKVSVRPASPAAETSLVLLPPGVSTGQVGHVFSFGVDTYDRFGNRVRSGGALVSAQASSAQSTAQAAIIDHEDGAYTCSFITLEVGTYQLEVSMQGVLIGNASQCVDADTAVCASRGTCADLQQVLFDPSSSCCKCGGGTWRPPFRNISVIPGPMNVSTSFVVSRSILTCTVGETTTLRIGRRDRYYNPTFYNAMPANAVLQGSSETRVLKVREVGTELRISWNVTKAGVYSLSLTTGGIGELSIVDSPFSVDVRPGALEPLKSSFFGPGLSVATAGFVSTFTLMTKDQYGNTVRPSPTEGSPPFMFEIQSSDDMFQASIVGMNNESMLVAYDITRSGQYRLNVFFGTGRLSVYAYTPLVIQADVIDISKVILNSVPSLVVAGKRMTFVATAQDQYFNKFSTGGADFRLLDVTALQAQSYSMYDWVNGTYSYELQFQAAVKHNIHVLLGSQRVTKQPYVVAVNAQPLPSAPRSFASGSGLAGGRVGSVLDINIFLRDAYDNPLPSSTAVSLTLRVEYPGGGGDITPSVVSADRPLYRCAFIFARACGVTCL